MLETRYEHVATRCYTLSHARPSKKTEHDQNYRTYELRINIRYANFFLQSEIYERNWKIVQELLLQTK